MKKNKFTYIRKKLKEEAPANVSGVNVSTDTPVVKHKPKLIRRKLVNLTS